MLSITNITKSYGFHQVLNGASFTVQTGECIGLVGANGVGKSTILKIIMGQVEADSGTVTIPDGWRVGYLEQSIQMDDGWTLDDMIQQSMQFLYDLEAQMRELEAQMTQVEGDTLEQVMLDYGEITERFERYGGYDMDYQVDIVLNGLGVGHIPRGRVFMTLSGGEKSRVGLAMLLLSAPDILLLDEPTNHLDFQSLTWLEDYLQSYRGAILIVSHDRQFLNRTVKAIIEIDEHSRVCKRYAGNYDAYHAAKLLEKRKWQEDYKKQQEEIKELRLAIKVTARNNNNYRAKYAFSGDKLLRNAKKAQHDATVSKRIRKAEEKLKRIEDNPIPEPPDDLLFNPDFDPQALRGRMPLSVSGLSKSYDGRCILDNITFSLGLHDRVVLVGPNGAGKSTLLKLIMGIERLDAGEVMINPAVNIGYLDQQEGLLDSDKTVFEAYKEGLPGHEQQLMSILLRSGLFRYDELEKRIHQLSSGQYRKVQIARLIAGRTNLLILDEPTNYVSFDVLEGLETALSQFPGPILAASHDRRFMQQFGGQIWEIRHGRITKYLGGYEEYVARYSLVS